MVIISQASVGETNVGFQDLIAFLMMLLLWWFRPERDLHSWKGCGKSNHFWTQEVSSKPEFDFWTQKVSSKPEFDGKGMSYTNRRWAETLVERGASGQVHLQMQFLCISSGSLRGKASFHLSETLGQMFAWLFQWEEKLTAKGKAQRKKRKVVWQSPGLSSQHFVKADKVTGPHMGVLRQEVKKLKVTFSYKAS